MINNLSTTLRLSFSSVLLCLPIISHSTPANYPDTLLDIYKLAQTNDHQLKADYAEYLANREAASIGRADLLPQLNGTATLSDNDTDTDTRNTVSATNTSNITETDEKSYSLTLTQNLINLNAWHTYLQGKTQALVAEATYQANQQSLIIRSAQGYFNVLRELDQLQTALAEEKAQATLLEQTRQRYEVGLISINDVHETQAAYDSAVANRINTEANVGIQLDSLTLLTGKLHTRIAPLKEEFPVVAPEPSNQQAWVDFALANNFTLKASQLTAKAARHNAKAANSNHAPTLSGRIDYTDRDQDVNIIDGLSTNNQIDNTVVSLNLTVPIYSGGRISAQRRQAKHNAINAKEDYLFTQRSTVQNIRSLYLTVTTDIAQIKARKQAIISNESALEATKAGYDAGTRDIVDVVNAQSNLFQAQRDYLNTLYDYIINTLLLKEAAGNLQVSDLQHLESLLAPNQ